MFTAWVLKNSWILGIMLLAACFFCGYTVAHRIDVKHETAALAEQQNKFDQVTAQINAASKKALEDAQKKYADLQQQLDALNASSYKALQDEKTVNDKLRADVASGALRLSIRGTCTPSLNPAAVPGDSGASGLGNDAAGRVQLNGEDAQALLAITAEADVYRKQVTYLQEYIKSLRKKYNIHD